MSADRNEQKQNTAEPPGLRSLAREFGYGWLDEIDVEKLDRDLLARTSFQFARANLVLPLRTRGGGVVVATARPLDIEPLDDLRVLYGAPVEIVVADEATLKEAINRAYDLSAGSAREIMDTITEEDGLGTLTHGLPADLLETSEEAPVIRLVNSILVQAAKEKASDIHIEPYERELAVRFRVDGALRDVVSPPKKLQPLIASRVKIMAGMDIAEKRLPQDGRLKIVIAGKEIDIRISVIPTAHGERIVMRLLDKSSMLFGFDQIGMKGRTLDRFLKMIHAPHGIILVSGPTGSGKTTTLYTALSHINSSEKNIITVEDPVEYQLKGIGQMQVNAKIGLTFASGLRSILRQDPDVIMVGEIRDLETAQIAVQASLTGHLVFSTIHTNDSAGAITRLEDMGIEPFLISSSILGVMAQRLVRVLCRKCREAYSPRPEHLAQIGINAAGAPPGAVFYRASGCDECAGTGYSGRTGIYELLDVDDTIRSLILKNADSSVIRKTAMERGFKTMRQYGASIIMEGVTSLEEVARVTSDTE